MELATPPPAARAPVAWYSWWLMPLAMGGGTVAATFMSSERITAAVAGAAVTAAGSVCVRLLIRSQRQLRGLQDSSRTTQAEHSQQWQQHVAGLERKFAAERASLEAQLTEQGAAFEAQAGERAAAQEAQLADAARAYEERLADQAKSYEAQLADRAEIWEEQLAHQRAAVALLADEQLPEALEQLRDGDAIDDVLPGMQFANVAPDLQADLRRILRTSLMSIEEELNRSTSAEQAVISIGNRIHVLTSKLRGRLHEMQGEHGRLPTVARGLMQLDQELGPADSLAASIGVLGGSDRPGRQWQEPQRLLSVVRGGIGRIKDFHRVEVRHLPELGVDGGLVDHLTLIFAHLLDNAARYSPPTERVVISGKEVPNGVGIEIQDSGKGLSEEKKREAEHSLAGTAPGPGLGGVSEDATIGLRVVGILARRYGIRVTFADSPWLGTSVVVVVPHKYFSALPAAPSAVPAADPIVPAPAPAAAPAPVVEQSPVAAPPAAEPAEVLETTPGGLPRRRSRRRETEPSEEAGRGGATAVSAVPPDASFAGLAAFATAGRDSAGHAHAESGEAAPGPAPEAAAGSAESAARESTEHRTEESD
ncbi:sensor histidine kinase KdpD [Streptomyces shenzhenensis]|uniref:histidine kinase n=1 Tax=Streptomyces shenzhenensis TaxID=943815 RepID=A0A3M0IIC1_9ACTN|nr:ATP-binding protein [Streptomyces shenzhenensis]RMB86019.1 ATP-binding protein [Streptomyces shenzhenensis]